MKGKDRNNIIGFTGTQDGMTPSQLSAFRMVFEDLITNARPMPMEFHHGDCIGADAEAHKAVEGLAKIIIHPPEKSEKRAFRAGDIALNPLPYLERNHAIVDACDVLIACPKTIQEKRRSGTWATVRYAKKQEKLICIIYPSGRLTWGTL